MGFSKKHQVELSKDSEGRKWVIAGVAIRSPLKPISIMNNREEDNEDGGTSTTPTARESKIPEKLACPPPPRKRRPGPTCHYSGVREFFNPPDLESVFMCHTGRAN